MLGGYISDLEPGDVFTPVEYVLTADMAAEYAHGCEETAEMFLSPVGPGGRQVRPPTMVHADKMRMLDANTTKERRLQGIKSNDARVHYQYHCHNHSIGYVGETFRVTCRITGKYVKRNRHFLTYHMEVHAGDGRLICTYDDITLLRYRPDGENANG